jgi:hypothetical protein
MHYNMQLCALKKKKKLPHSTQNKTCSSDVNVSLNSETTFCSQLLVDCCTLCENIIQCYKIYAYSVLRTIR